MFRAAQKIPIAPVLKSNAYGHGLVEVGKIVAEAGVPFICVNSIGEAAALRAAASTPILIIGWTPLASIRDNALPDIAFGIVSIEALRELAEADVPARVHLEIDTGMHRHGIMPEEIDEAVAILAAHPAIELEGIYSHLADGDTKDSALTQTQIRRWNEVVKTFRENIPSIRYVHLSATSGVAYAPQIDANVARLGIGLYGFNESLVPLDLRPALEVQTVIASIRSVPKGERVGYNGTYIAKEERRIATVPMGYFEGIDRRLSNKGFMLVGGEPCPIVGRVSMNITSIDVTDVPQVALGDKVVAISASPSDPNSVAHIAEVCNTIPYEILVHIPSALSRVIV